MSYSDIVGSISGLLQFAVACYALRVSRRFGAPRLGWTIFGAFTLLAAVHVLLSVQLFGTRLELSPSVNLLYEVISILLLGTIAQVELLLWQRRRQAEAEQQARAQEEAKVKEQIEQLTRTGEESRQNAAQLQAEAAKQIQALEQAQVEAEKSFHDQLAAAHQTEATLRESVGRLESEVSKQFELRIQEQNQTQALAEAEKLCQEQLAALKQSEEEWRSAASRLTDEVAQQKQTLEETGKSYQEQLDALRQSEDLWRADAARLQTELAEMHAAKAAEPPPPPPPRAPVEETVPEPVQAQVTEPVVPVVLVDPLAILRQSGIAEVATLTQSRVAYLARLAKLMRDHSRDLSKFITRHPQGKQLPNSLSLLIEYLSDEQFLLVKRIDFVKKKFEENRPVQPVATDENPHVNGVVTPVEATLPPAAPEPEPATASYESIGDLSEHLISNVTETGTEGAAGAELTDQVSEPGVPNFLLDPSETQH